MPLKLVAVTTSRKQSLAYLPFFCFCIFQYLSNWCYFDVSKNIFLCHNFLGKKEFVSDVTFLSIIP